MPKKVKAIIISKTVSIFSFTFNQLYQPAKTTPSKPTSMNKNRLILYIVFGAFHLGAFIFTVVLDNNTSLLFKMVSWVPWFKWITFLGLLILITDVVWAWKANKDAAKEKAALALDLNTLKAKLFDLQEAGKTPSTSKITDRS